MWWLVGRRGLPRASDRSRGSPVSHATLVSASTTQIPPVELRGRPKSAPGNRGRPFWRTITFYRVPIRPARAPHRHGIPASLTSSDQGGGA